MKDRGHKKGLLTPHTECLMYAAIRGRDFYY